MKENDTATFWEHFRRHIGDHPAIGEHDRDPTQRWHHPVGVFGDDARYTLAGRKVIILLLSSVLQTIERDFDPMKLFHFHFKIYIDHKS